MLGAPKRTVRLTLLACFTGHLSAGVITSFPKVLVQRCEGLPVAMSQAASSLVSSMRARGAREPRRHGVPLGTDPHAMRQSNRLLILNCVREHEPLPRAEVARLTGLSRTTVGHIIDALIAEGFLRDGNSQRARASAGRRVIPVYFNATAAYVLGVSVGRSHLTLVLSDLSAGVVGRVDTAFDITSGPDRCLPIIVQTIRNFVASHQIAWTDVIGIGVGLPGTMDTQLEGLISERGLPGWKGVNLRERLSAELSTPIYLDNNANLGALGEMRYGSGQGVTNLLYVKLGTRIGSGVVINGQLYRGSSGSAGEIGHMTVDPDGPRCDCGSSGCLKTFAGSPAILAQARQKRREIASFDDLVGAARAGDTACLDVLARAGEVIGIALASLVNFFNPALIVLDGSTMRAGELILNPVRESMARRSLPAPFAHIEIVPSALGGTAIARGGVATVLDAAFRPPTVSRLPLKERGDAERQVVEHVG